MSPREPWPLGSIGAWCARGIIARGWVSLRLGCSLWTRAESSISHLSAASYIDTRHSTDEEGLQCDTRCHPRGRKLLYTSPYRGHPVNTSKATSAQQHRQQECQRKVSTSYNTLSCQSVGLLMELLLFVLARPPKRNQLLCTTFWILFLMHTYSIHT